MTEYVTIIGNIVIIYYIIIHFSKKKDNCSTFFVIFLVYACELLEINTFFSHPSLNSWINFLLLKQSKSKNSFVTRQAIYMNIANIMTVISFTIVTIIVITLIIIGTYIFYIDRKQKQHPILRNYPLLGRARYFLEQIGPELRQYFFNHDLEGKPFSRKDY